jgi:hypothetical protein
VCGLGVFLVLALLTGGMFVQLALAFGGLGLVALFHYLAWGRTMDRKVAEDPQEAEMRRRAEEDDWPLPESDRITRF